MRRGLQQGVTMTEVMIAILIMVVVALLFVPNYVNYVKQNHLIGAAESLSNDLNQINMQRQKQVTINMVVTTGATWCYGFTSGGTCDCMTPNACNYGQNNYTNYSDTSLASSGFTNPISVGTFVFSNTSGQSITINANTAGNSYTCSDTVGGYPGC